MDLAVARAVQTAEKLAVMLQQPYVSPLSMYSRGGSKARVLTAEKLYREDAMRAASRSTCLGKVQEQLDSPELAVSSLCSKSERSLRHSKTRNFWPRAKTGVEAMPASLSKPVLFRSKL